MKTKEEAILSIISSLKSKHSVKRQYHILNHEDEMFMIDRGFNCAYGDYFVLTNHVGDMIGFDKCDSSTSWVYIDSPVIVATTRTDLGLPIIPSILQWLDIVKSQTSQRTINERIAFACELDRMHEATPFTIKGAIVEIKLTSKMSTIRRTINPPIDENGFIIIKKWIYEKILH